MYPQRLHPIPGANRAAREGQHNLKGARGGQRIVSGLYALEITKPQMASTSTLQQACGQIVNRGVRDRGRRNI